MGDSAVDGQNDPKGHAAGAAAPARQYVPLGHGVATATLAAQKDAAGQPVGATAPNGQKDPAGHAVQLGYTPYMDSGHGHPANQFCANTVAEAMGHDPALYGISCTPCMLATCASGYAGFC